MISKFYTLKGSRESRKGRCRKTSDVKTCNNKAREKEKKNTEHNCIAFKSHNCTAAINAKNCFKFLQACEICDITKDAVYGH